MSEKTEVEKLREVLEFYAAPSTWEQRWAGEIPTGLAINDDKGRRAREALGQE